MNFYTADHHFGHANILKFQKNRRDTFGDIEEHDEGLIKRWNEVVSPSDTVYHIGDISFRMEEDRLLEILKRLNGEISLILGNHDQVASKGKCRNRFRFVDKYMTVHDKDIDRKIFLCHYSMNVWNASHHGVWHLYGHSHGSLPDNPNSMSFDVGVDCHDFYPIDSLRVAELMSLKNYAPIDHHR